MSDPETRKEKLEKLHRLREELIRLEMDVYDGEADEIPDSSASHANFTRWRPEGYYLAYHLIAGFVIGCLGALASLMFNVIGSTLVGLYPLEIIRVYLTFPLGEKALSLNGGLAMGIGCTLYLTTGAIYGMVFHYVLSRYYEKASLSRRLAAVTAMSLVLWLVNFYAVLSWLQPQLFGGNWIVADIPFYVAAATHLVFGWSVALLGEWGHFDDQWRGVPASA